MTLKKYQDNPNYPESDLTNKIIKCSFEVFKSLGYGLPERNYQSALAHALDIENLKYSKEKYGKIIFKDKIIGKYFLDFLIEEKVAVEMKVRNMIYETDKIQLLNYLKSKNLKVGLLLVVTKHGVRVKRIINNFQRISEFISG